MITGDMRKIWLDLSNQEKQDLESRMRNRDVMWSYIRKDEVTSYDVLKYLTVEYHGKQRARLVKDLLGRYHALLQKEHWNSLLTNSLRFRDGQSGE